MQVATPLSSSTPNPSVPDGCEQFKSIIKEFTEVRGIQTAFNAFMLHDSNYSDELYSAILDRLSKFLKDIQAQDSPQTSEVLSFSAKQLVKMTGDNTNEETVDILMKIIESLITNSALPARLVCETLLESDKLTYKNSKFWISSFILIKKVISNVDYKGVREIMKTCLDKVATFPQNVPQQYLPQLNAINRLLKFIFDRNNSLLPAYFIVNEILKSYPENRHFPHWSIIGLLSEFVDTFRSTAQIVSLVGRSRMLPAIVEHSGFNVGMLHSWKLDQNTLRFILKGNLPYDKELLLPQERLLRYILEQPYSRDMACAILGLQKQHKIRCPTLETRLVELVVLAMEKTEAEMNLASDSQIGIDDVSVSGTTLWLWQHLSTQLIFFVLFQFASFPHIVLAVNEKLAEVKLFKGRDFLMWILLQFISGSIQKNLLADFLPVLGLYDLLYPEKDPISVPDITKPYCTAQMSATCIWIHVLKKAQMENINLPRPLPATLKKQFDFLQMLVQPGGVSQQPLTMNDFRTALLCNAFSTNQELFSRPMASLVEAIHGVGPSGSSSGPTVPLSVQVLDALTVHTKMSLIHNIVTHIMKTAQSKNNQGLAPALVETYSRLLVYMEIESLGIKGFISQLLPAVYKSQAWGILHTLLEMFCYRLHHIQPHYRIQLLSHLYSLSANAPANLAQLHLCVEMTTLKVITGFNSFDVHYQFSRIVSESKTLVSSDSEELNRALVLTMARAIHASGTDSATWFRDILASIMQNTPHNWSSHTQKCFPPLLAEYFQQNQISKENKQQLKNMVEEEYRNWNAMSSNENDLIEHFSLQGTPPLFLCIIYKMIIESDRINPIAFKILERIGPKGVAAHLRKFCDYVVSEFSNAGAGQHVNKLTDAITDLVWKYNIVPFDRLLLTMTLRTQEGNEAQVCFFIIHLLMVKPVEFRTRIQEFVKDNTPEHWKNLNWHDKHKAFNTKFPEVFLFEEQQQNQLPVYFGNVCLRFLPVFDIVIHRFLEINVVGKSLEMILDHMGSLYKFHDRPITYLYNTLHYYESRLRDKPNLKKKLVSSILGSLKDIKPPNWALTDQYNAYLNNTDENWNFEIDYYASLISRLVDVIEGKKRFFTGIDWRYNEFPNPAAHVLHCICVEILALPIVPGDILIDAVLQGRALIDNGPSNSSPSVVTSLLDSENEKNEIEPWFNAAGLIFQQLPEPYWLVLHERIYKIVEKLQNWPHKHSPLALFNFKTVHNCYLYSEYSSILGLTHAFWTHLGAGHTHHILTLVTEQFTKIVKNEIQLLYVCHLIGPFLQRFNAEKPNLVCRLTVALYELLEIVDKATPKPLEFLDVICDLLYHIKYMFTGDIVKNEVEAKIKNLRPELQKRLRFITHLRV